MPRRAERCLQIAPHSLAIVLVAAGERAGGRAAGGGGGGAGPELGRHRIGYEIFADFKRENMQHFWDRRATAAVAETFFLGWIDEQVLLVQGKEEHLEVLRQGWARRSLRPPAGFHIKCLGLLASRGLCSGDGETNCLFPARSFHHLRPTQRAPGPAHGV
ncbi:storkhead-box protein 1-like isoform X2 [Rissa tridactyla]|uniref:storkhead-box protein 1-like isoform X2 n=1 Tax=Rissa tridactyla TaxID=75485 RepID=UPI0023BA5E0B|nr:storkhead-box protein 1-like isoform X2 [Rissa tridactyla]